MLINYRLILLARTLAIMSLLLVNISIMEAHAFPFRTIKQGDPVPDVPLSPMEKDKSAVTFSELKGNPFIVIFWGADLPEKIKYSSQVLGGIEELAPFLNERNIRRYSVNVQDDDSTAINEVVEKSESTIDIYRDNNQKAYEALGIYVMPAVLLVDRDGNVVDGFGYSRDMVERLKGSVEIMLGEKTEEQVAAELRPEMKEASAEAKASSRHFNFGMVMIKRGMIDSAIREFSKAAEIDPTMSKAYLQLGCLYLDSKDLENAEISINKALEADPDSVKGKICRGELLRLQGQLNEAAELLQKVISAHPENYEAHYYLGRVLEDMQKNKEAVESFKKAYRYILHYSATKK